MVVNVLPLTHAAVPLLHPLVDGLVPTATSPSVPKHASMELVALPQTLAIVPPLHPLMDGLVITARTPFVTQVAKTAVSVFLLVFATALTPIFSDLCASLVYP
jgi:hypothetical protein